MNFNIKVKPVLLLFGLASFVLLAWRGCQDKIDPDWVNLESDLQRDYFTLHKAADSLQFLWESIHRKDPQQDTLHAYNLMADPFMPTMEFSKFKEFAGLFLDNQFLLLSSVSGGGTSTLVNRLSKFLASTEEHLLYLRCAPQFDLIYHHQYIGEEKNGIWEKGKLLQFLEHCEQNPMDKFVFVIDDFDKINPETFFGPEIWEKFNDRDYQVEYGGEPVALPENFYMLMVTHAGVGDRVKLNNGHFRRLGNPIHIEPSIPELICYLQGEKQKYQNRLENANNSEQRSEFNSKLEGLEDTFNLKRLVYTFSKINEHIYENYGPSYRLGTWSNVRKLYGKNDFEQIFVTFTDHVNSLQPNHLLSKNDLDKITHALRKNGKLKGTNFIRSMAMKMEEMGFLTEFIVGLTFLILSALTSWYFYKKRQQFIKKYTDQTYKLIQDFENGDVDYDQASEEIARVKKEVDVLVLNKKVTYTEATFFYNFIEDKIKRIEMSRAVNANFQDLVRVFLEDNVLSQSEYRKLLSFLEEIRYKIGIQDYIRFKEEVEELYEKFKDG